METMEFVLAWCTGGVFLVAPLAVKEEVVYGCGVGVGGLKLVSRGGVGVELEYGLVGVGRNRKEGLSRERT